MKSYEELAKQTDERSEQLDSECPDQKFGTADGGVFVDEEKKLVMLRFDVKVNEMFLIPEQAIEVGKALIAAAYTLMDPEDS